METAMSSVRKVDDRAGEAALRNNTHALYLIVLLVIACAVGATVYFNGSMSGGMAMPGNWTMSMMWMSMGDELRAAAIFIVMWVAMMVAMMLPSSMPMLLLYRRVAAFRGEGNIGKAIFALGSGYFFIWTLFGVAAYLIGTIVTQRAMHSDTFSRALPLAGGLALCAAGIYQLTPWKSACLRHCRDPLTLISRHQRQGHFGALRVGIHHGAVCAACCWALMLIQLVLGVMNLTVMVTVAVVIALEKLFPRGESVAKAVGLAAIVVGVIMATLSVRAL
ncbi:MAG TPA: DUF2182 domain-containing protein [Candidatus Acidoferrales bacterium]|nr:DUF2182 domain-containing protein [Candidatus Acidoferrales bacterium]